MHDQTFLDALLNTLDTLLNAINALSNTLSTLVNILNEGFTNFFSLAIYPSFFHVLPYHNVSFLHVYFPNTFIL